MATNRAAATVEAYLSELKEIRASGAGVPETSYYPTLAGLFNAVGVTLKPKVRCMTNLKNLGAGMPDAGLFTADQSHRSSDTSPGVDQLPSRGAIEVKGTKPDVKEIAASEQVKNYLRTYGIVIVSNLRDFLIVELDPNGQPVERESFALADDEQDFWERKAARPRATAQQKGTQFIEFIKRACLHAAPLLNPKDVARFLASYAITALSRVEQQKQLPALQTIRSALEDALGMKFTADKGEHFFRSTLVQTLFYGVFSAWVSWHKADPGPSARFDWRTAEWSLHVPFIRTLYRQVAEPNQLGQLGLVELLDWAAGVLNRVDRGEFFKRFEDEHAVQYFYEPFLEAYDPDLRKELGVWYTPPEIVKYQVARVDTVLREELDLPDGLADPNVIVLDPCCGTGAYLVEVLRRIATILRDKAGDALVASDLKEAAMNRVFGFEILPGPFVVSHLQLGLMLQREGAPLSHETGERVGVYLTNSLTGWDATERPKQQVMAFAGLGEERDAAANVKQQEKILVVIGNPPYNSKPKKGKVDILYSAAEAASPSVNTAVYKEGLNKPIREGGWGIKKFNLDDLYVRFFRLAERRIAEMSGKGVVSFISNFSYLGDPSFVVMRQRFLAEFDKLWLDCMNGDSRETGKLTPDGKPDPSVFSTDYNREGIQLGTAVCVIVRRPARRKKPIVRFRQFWGVDKRAELLDSLKTRRFDATYTLACPSRENRLSFRPENVTGDYESWPKLVELCAVAPFNGPVERRGNSLIRFPSQVHEFEYLRAYLDPTAADSGIRLLEPRFMLSSGEFHAEESRMALKGKVRYDVQNVVHYPFKPFDVRAAYLDPAIQPLFSRPSPQLLAQRFPGNGFFLSRDTADKAREGPPFFFSRLVCDYDCISGHARHFPVLLRNGSRLEREAEATLFAALGEKPQADRPVANLSARVREYLVALRFGGSEADVKTARLVWMHALAIGYSPLYLSENADGVRRDWPRIPLPADRQALEASASLGEQIAALLDTETEVHGVTAGKFAPVFKTIGPTTKIGDAVLDLAVTAGWGHPGKGGVVMPAKGRLSERAYDAEELKAIEAEAAKCGMASRDVIRLLGEKTCDVYLNHAAYWRNIPVNVWEYYIGGYQVIKKWLSYREEGILGRAISPEEAREVTNMARRIAAILLLQPKLDENYRAVKTSTFPWGPA
ncbi:MAG: N-6 DNA methylase [Phycisphaerae bacterium]|nr:N-6 DNA methylase [Phycisphaerae bacterium]